MGFRLRRLLDDPNDTNNDTTALCATKCRLTNDTMSCDGFCARFNLPPPQKHTHLNKILITSLVLSAIFFLVFCYAIYRKFCSSSSRTRRPDQQTNDTTTTHEQFFDEEHGPVLDHHIWYINTIGLQPSVINSISVVKYKRGDGLIEGTDCSVCLNEFQEDETLRLLPKCSHAFHINCIDTWLRSHTNCPLCRAPIVANSSRASLNDGHSESSSSGEETQIGVVETAVEDGGDQGVSDDQIEVGVFPIRRSVSLDSLSALKISQDMASVCEVKDGEFDIEIDRKRDGNASNQRLVKSRASSSIGRSLQIGPSSMKRSISCGAKLFLARYSRSSSNSRLPL